MFWNRTEDEIVSQWQIDLSHGAEMGERAPLLLGTSDSALDGLLAVQTAHHFLHHRCTVAPPLLMMGGNSVLWLYGAVQASAASHTPDTAAFRWLDGQPQAALLFTGVDPATHMVGMGICGTSQVGAALGVPRTMQWLYAPLTEPAADAPWSAAPFLFPPAEEVQSRAMAHPGVQPADAGNSQSAWLAWFTMAMIVIILLTALIGG